MNKPILIGKREQFGLDIEVTSWVPYIFACVRLWIGGEYLGREDDPVVLRLVMDSLDGALGRGTNESLTAELLSIPADAAFDRLEGIIDPNTGPLYHLPTTEFFDPYDIYCVSNHQVARFLWKARYWEPDVLHDVRVPCSEIVRTLHDLHAVYNALSQIQKQQDKGR